MGLWNKIGVSASAAFVLAAVTLTLPVRASAQSAAPAADATQQLSLPKTDLPPAVSAQIKQFMLGMTPDAQNRLVACSAAAVGAPVYNAVAGQMPDAKPAAYFTLLNQCETAATKAALASQQSELKLSQAALQQAWQAAPANRTWHNTRWRDGSHHRYYTTTRVPTPEVKAAQARVTETRNGLAAIQREQGAPPKLAEILAPLNSRAENLFVKTMRAVPVPSAADMETALNSYNARNLPTPAPQDIAMLAAINNAWTKIDRANQSFDATYRHVEPARLEELFGKDGAAAKAARRFGLDANDLAAIPFREGVLNPNQDNVWACNPYRGACGPYQFEKDTFSLYVGMLASGGSIADPVMQAGIRQSLENSEKLRQLVRIATGEEKPNPRTVKDRKGQLREVAVSRADWIAEQRADIEISSVIAAMMTHDNKASLGLRNTQESLVVHFLGAGDGGKVVREFRSGPGALDRAPAEMGISSIAVTYNQRILQSPSKVLWTDCSYAVTMGNLALDRYAFGKNATPQVAAGPTPPNNSITMNVTFAPGVK